MSAACPPTYPQELQRLTKFVVTELMETRYMKTLPDVIEAYTKLTLPKVQAVYGSSVKELLTINEKLFHSSYEDYGRIFDTILIAIVADSMFEPEVAKCSGMWDNISNADYFKLNRDDFIFHAAKAEKLVPDNCTIHGFLGWLWNESLPEGDVDKVAEFNDWEATIFEY